MKNPLKTAFCVVLGLMIFSTACKKDDDNGGSTAQGTCSDGIQNQNETGVDCGGSCAACPPPLNPSMTAMVDGVAWTATSTSAVNQTGTLSIMGSKPSTSEGITLSHSGTFQTGTYSLGYYSSNYAKGSTVNCICDSGTITFTKFDTQNKVVSGTFSFGCTDPNTSVSQNITSGSFTDIAY